MHGTVAHRMLVQDGAAPVYAQLLEMAGQRMGNCMEYYTLWPTRRVDEPWATLQKAVFVAVSSSFNAILLLDS